MVEGEAGTVRTGVVDRAQMAGGNTGLEDQILVRLRHTVAIVENGEGSVAASLQRRGDEDVSGFGVAGVTQEFYERVLDVVEARGGAADSLDARQAGETRAEVAVGALYRATSLTRLSRMTVTLIWPGYSRSLSICLEIS